MGAYVIRRLLLMLLMLFLVTVAVFVLFSLVPTDPARLTCGKACTPEIIEANRERLGLADPLLVQYWEWFKGLFVGRTYAEGTPVEFSCPAPALGYSFRKGECVTQLIVTRMPVTIWLAVGAFILWMVAGVLSGIFAALRRGKWQDRLIVSLALVGYSFPTFFIGLTLLFFVVIRWGILPYPDYVPPTEDPVQWLQTMILPWITVALVYAAFYTRLTRTQMLETLGEDYIRSARAKGLPERVVIRKHAFRAGLTPIVTAAGLDFAGLLGGAVVTETIFQLPGVGRLAIESVQDYDLPIIVGTTVIFAVIVIVANLIVDLLYAVIDPRVRLA
jgi:peptide/nickel transport system permease protein